MRGQGRGIMGREASFSGTQVIREARKQPISLLKASSEDVQGFIRSHAAALIYSPKKIDTISICSPRTRHTGGNTVDGTFQFSFRFISARFINLPF